MLRNTGIILLIFPVLVSLSINHWKIGVVREGNGGSYTEVESVYTHNITYVWYEVSVEEIYQTFRAVHELEVEHKADIIITLQSERYPSTVITSNVPLIRWGHVPEYTEKGAGYRRVSMSPSTRDICTVVQAQFVKEPYCLKSTSVLDIMKTTNPAKVFRRKVELRGPDILSVLINEYLQWKEVFIFHDNETEYESSELLSSLSKNGVKSVVYNIDDIEALNQVVLEAYLRAVPDKLEIHFAVLCKFDCLRRLFYQANRFDAENKKKKTLLKQFSSWLVASFDYHSDVYTTLRDCASDLDNIAVIAFPRLRNEAPEKAFRKALRTTITDLTSDDDVIEDGPSLVPENVSFRQNLIEKLTQKAKCWRSVDQCDGIQIDTLMWTSNGRDFGNVGFVSKTSESGVFIHADLFPNLKYGYNKRHFRISTLHFPPFVIKREVNGTATYGGICMDLLTQLAKTLNFTYTLTEPADQTWGRPGPNNTFNGMIGQLQREEVDIVAADTTIQKERELVMDFMFPFYYGYTSVLLKKPSSNAGKWRTLVDPFKWEVLMAIGICLPVVSLIAFLLEKYNPYYTNAENAREPTDSLKSFVDAFWYMYGALLSQGGMNLPESFAGRTIVSSWWLFSIVIVGTYCGNLIAFLTVTKDKPPFETLNEMADLKGTYKWGLQGGTNREHVFETSKRPEFRRVGDAIKEFSITDRSVLTPNYDVHLAKVKQGGYGWIGDTVVMDIEMAKDCELMMMKEKFLPLRYAFGFTNNSPHVQIFTKQMLAIHESGLLQVWKRRWWPKSKAICSGSIVAEAKPISIIDVQSAFYVAAGGACLGFCVFLMELCVGKCYRRYKYLGNRETKKKTEINNG